MELFEHQIEMIKAAKEQPKGILQAPTGSGKTFAQAGIVRQELLKGGFKIVMVKTPRIGLTNQVAEEYMDFLTSKGMKPNSLLVHSGNSIEVDPDKELDLEEQLANIKKIIKTYVNATTSTKELISQIKRSKELDIPFLIFTTYHSATKVINALDREDFIVNLDLNDEAHYLVREDFASILELTIPERQYFFTATAVHSTAKQEGRGMQNSDRFGKTIYHMSIAEAVSRGLILPVKPEIIKSGQNDVVQQDTDAAVGQFVHKAFNTIERNFPNLGTKLLVSVRGSRQIGMLLESMEFNMLLNANVNVLTVHSSEEFTTFNGRQITRKEFDQLKDQLGKDVSSRLIIVHYDILAEGIDVPGLLGVLILRNMQEAKFLQTIGRVLRVYRKNPDLKKYGMLFFPEINDIDLAQNFVKMLERIVEKGYLPSQMINEFLTPGSEVEEDELDQTESFASVIRSQLDLRLYTERLDIKFEDL